MVAKSGPTININLGKASRRLLGRPDLVAWLAVAAGLAYLAVRSVEFIAQNGYPAGYFYDLGVNIMATSYQATTIRSFQDVLDCIGWAAWGDVPQFAYTPMTTSVVLVSIVKLGASVQSSIKIVMVLEFWLALLSMAYLYHGMRRSVTWSLAAGVLYAFFPAAALQMSSNLDLGFCVALTPLALALGLRLVRRFGLRGLPLAGAICGFAGQGFATEYLLIVSLPVYTAVALTAYAPRQLFRWAAASLAGAICAVGVGLYCIIPTFSSNTLLTSAATRIAASEGQSVLALFGESIGALWHGVLAESTLSPSPEFNVTPTLWATSIALTMLWWGALAFAIRRIPRGGSTKRQAILVAALILLAFGPAVPFSATFWLVLARIPLLNFLRTPDRLMVVPFAFLVWWGVAMLQTLHSSGLRSKRRVLQSYPLIALVIAGYSFAYFDFASAVLIVRPNLDYRLPGLVTTNAAALKQPRPLATYAFVNQGDVLDTPLYGAGVPARLISADLISRYGAGPAHALGMLRKAGVQTLVTSPVWASGGTSWPDLGSDYATSRWTDLISGSSSSAAVWHLRDSAPAVSRAELACYHGGPGPLDELSLVPGIDRLALERESTPCQIAIYSNADPRDDSLPHSIASWSGAALGSGTPIRDQDYPFFLADRTLLARSWYRDAIEGDSPVFGAPAVAIPSTWRADVTANVAAGGAYLANARAATATGLCFFASIDHGPQIKRCEGGGYGFHWLALPLRLHGGKHSIVFGFGPKDASAGSGSAILDGISIGSRDTTLAAQADSHPRIITYSTPWAKSGASFRPLWLMAGRYRIAWFSPDGTLIGDSLLIDGRRFTGNLVVGQSRFQRVGGPPADATMLVLFGRGTERVLSSDQVGRRRSATSWDINLRSRGAVRVTTLDDHSWLLDGAGRHFYGFDCDLVDTCFSDVPPGRYILRHRWPAAIVLGIWASAITWLLAALPVGIEVIRRRTPKLGT